MVLQHEAECQACQCSSQTLPGRRNPTKGGLWRMTPAVPKETA